MLRKELNKYLPNDLLKIVLSYNIKSNMRMNENRYKLLVKSIRRDNEKLGDGLKFSKNHFERVKINKILNEIKRELIIARYTEDIKCFNMITSRIYKKKREINKIMDINYKFYRGGNEIKEYLICCKFYNFINEKFNSCETINLNGLRCENEWYYMGKKGVKRCKIHKKNKSECYKYFKCMSVVEIKKMESKYINKFLHF